MRMNDVIDFFFHQDCERLRLLYMKQVLWQVTIFCIIPSIDVIPSIDERSKCI